MVRRTRGGSLIVDLVADDGGTVLVMFENLADHSLTIKPVCRVRKVGILTVSVRSARNAARACAFTGRTAQNRTKSSSPARKIHENHSRVSAPKLMCGPFPDSSPLNRA